MSDRDRTAWGDYWSDQKGGAGGCLPEGNPAIDTLQTQVWRSFARRLPKRAAVLDLATGDGAVLRKLAGTRADLKLFGVDYAPTLPSPPKGMAIKSGVSVEELPYPPGRFDAVTSQFGYEYADTALAAREVKRVLRTGGELQCIVHHAGGPIVTHNCLRRAALEWAMGSGALDRARQLAGARGAAAIPTPDAFRAAVAEAQRRFPQQPVAMEFTLAILQCLERGRSTPPIETLRALDQLDAMARGELARIGSLERAVCDAGRIERMVAELDAGGVTMNPPETLAEPNAPTPFAWLLTGRRR